MDFLSWLDRYVLPEKLLNKTGKINGEFELRDVCGFVKVRIKNTNPAVIGLPENMGQWRILSQRDWYRASDFIVFGEHPAHGSFVFLIELKRTPKTLEEVDVDDDTGREKLRWNVSIFHYLFSLFKTDTIGQGPPPDFVIRRFLIGNEYSGGLGRRFHKEGVRGKIFDHEEFEGVWINFLSTHGSRLPIRVIDMLDKSK